MSLEKDYHPLYFAAHLLPEPAYQEEITELAELCNDENRKNWSKAKYDDFFEMCVGLFDVALDRYHNSWEKGKYSGFDFIGFIAAFYPWYSSSNTVAEIDDLTVYLYEYQIDNPQRMAYCKSMFHGNRPKTLDYLKDTERNLYKETLLCWYEQS